MAGRDVGSGARAAERGAARGVAAPPGAIHRSVRIGDDGVIQGVEALDPELSVEPLLEREGLEYGEIHVLEARVAEDVPAHRAIVSSRVRNHNRFAFHDAAG